MPQLSEQDRVRLREQLDALAQADAAIGALMEPYRTALANIQGARDVVLDSYGITGEPQTCEGCSALLISGDPVHQCKDGPTLCEACAPTLADCHKQLVERLAEADDEEERQELQEAVDACAARIAAGEGDKPEVYPL